MTPRAQLISRYAVTPFLPNLLSDNPASAKSKRRKGGVDRIGPPARRFDEFTDGGPTLTREHFDNQRLFGSRARHAISRLRSGAVFR